MGTHQINQASGEGDHRRAIQAVLRDLDALESMLESGAFETDTRRIGAEQELMLLDRACRPAPRAEELLARLNDPRIVPELARFNVEYNCDPIRVGDTCLTTLHEQLVEGFDAVQQAASEIGVTPLMTGICPTVDLADLSRDNLMPKDRYYALDDMLRLMRGGDFELHIEGADELLVRHPSVMLEAVNTSFQVHYQTTPDEFAAAYNTALAIAAPVLAVSVNSPILFGKRLWRETRIAIFQQVVDTRSKGAGHREMLGRVRFGESWVRESILEVFRADVARFKQVIIASEAETEDPAEALAEGRPPKLKALQAFNSSVYRWMRPCYGITDGKPHLRIENRVIPAGPTIEDEVANAAFWIGLMAEGPHAFADLPERMDFKEVRSNFLTAAQQGLSCHICWLDDTERSMRELLVETFIPAARAGLARLGVSDTDADNAISIIEHRIASRRTGARWLIDSAARLRGQGTRTERLDCLTSAMVANQRSGKPVHEWALVERTDERARSGAFATVSQCMSTDLFTVSEDECIDLVASIMDWERLRHIPVENDEHELVGLVSYRTLLRILAKQSTASRATEIAARDVMIAEPVTVTPETPSIDAIALMCAHKISCLPVVEEGRLVGMISERDYTAIAKRLLERTLLEDADG
jgi:CBS domain-containing protein